jgi:hypothetical protein
MPNNVNAVIAEIDGVLKRFDELSRQYREASSSNGAVFISAPYEIASQLHAMLEATITRLAPATDYGRSALKQHAECPMMARAGVLRALRDDYASGRILNLQERIRSDMFSDFLEMAEYLIADEGLKDPAAVLAGGVLEEQLRKLCDKHGIPTTVTDAKGNVRPKRLNALNDELANRNVYGRNEQKQVTAWAGIRNDAAHAEYDKYTLEEVKLMIAGTREFLNRNPA